MEYAVRQLLTNTRFFDMDIEEIRDDHVLADSVRLRQVLINLISNGVKYTPEHGCVQVKVTQGNSFAEGKASYLLLVKDNGIRHVGRISEEAV